MPNKKSDGVPKRLIIVLSAWIFVLAGVPAFWSTTVTHRPHLAFGALDALGNTTLSWMPVALQLVCHDAACDVLNRHVRTQLIEQGTASVVQVIRHEGDHTFSASPNPPCSHYAAHLSGLPVQTIPEGAIVLHIAQGCSGMHVVAHTHQLSAIVLPTEDASHNSILHSIQHVLGHGHMTLMVRVCISDTPTAQHAAAVARALQRQLHSTLAVPLHPVSYCTPPPASWSHSLQKHIVQQNALVPWLRENMASSNADMPIPDAVASSSIHCAGIQGLDPLHDHLLLQWLLYIPPALGGGGDGAPGGGGGNGAPSGGGSSNSSTASSHMHAAPPPNTLWLEIPGQPHQQTDTAWLPGEGGVVFLPPHTGAPVPDDAYDNGHTQDPVATSSHIATTCIAQHLRLQLHVGIGTDNNSSTQQEQEKVAMSWEGDAVFGQVYVQQLLQRQRVGNAAAAVRGMSALRDIVQALPTLSLPPIIGAYVQHALDVLQSQCDPNDHNPNSSVLIKSAQDMTCARRLADGALHHPAVMTRLSVPPEHQLAVYMPLLLPLLVPLVRGLVVETMRVVQHVRGRGT